MYFHYLNKPRQESFLGHLFHDSVLHGLLQALCQKYNILYIQ
jgi:hypothetical protein